MALQHITPCSPLRRRHRQRGPARRKPVTRIACLPILLIFAAPVTAEPIVATAPNGDAQSVLVSYADLNLGSDSGMARLESRLRAAARQVCDVRTDLESLRHK